MRRRVLAALYVFVFLLFCMSGCKKEDRADEKILKTGFSADYSAVLGDFEVSGRLVCGGKGIFSMSVSKPETLSGLFVSFRGGEVMTETEGLKSTADEAYLPKTSLPRVLKEIFDRISLGQYKYKESSEKTDCFTLSTGKGSWELEAENGYVIGARMVGEDIVLELSNITQTG